MTVDQKLRLMNNSPALLEAVALLLPLARKEAERQQTAADQWNSAVAVAEKALLASAPNVLAQTLAPEWVARFAHPWQYHQTRPASVEPPARR
jgi:hypothetical protein